MRAAIHNTFGDPILLMHMVDTTTPDPAPGQVLVKMIMSPIHNHDLWTIRGEYGYKPDLPTAVGGSEAVGMITDVGAGVDEALIGQRIAVASVHGTWAEYFVAPANGVMPLPAAISDTLGAQLVAMPFSAISLLETLNVSEGDWIVQTAANGAVGKIMAVLAKARGLNLLNLVRRPEAIAELQAMGMEHVLSTSDVGWKEQAQAIIGDAGARAAIDSVGGTVATDLTELLGDEGQLVIFGTATGTPVALNSGLMIFKHLTVKGFWASKVGPEMDPETRTRLMTELVGLALSGDLIMGDGGVYPLEEVTPAMIAAVTPGRFGKVMLRP